MATYTITSSVNIDSLTAKTGSDVYNINGGYLFVDQDTRFGKNQQASASFGTITLSATDGGTIEFNAQNVRLVAFTNGTGTVPDNGTSIVSGSVTVASGALCGVYTSLAAAPVATGSAMPTAGYLKIKQWNGVPFFSGTLTGISASSNGVDVPGWIEIVGTDAGVCTVNRLNTFKVRGEWYNLGTTSGTRATTYQIPSNGNVVYMPGVWVETAVSSGQYEFYPCVGTQTALIAWIGTEAVRAKVCWISTAGLVRFGHDGTNSTGGFCPAAGLRIRIPNIFFMCCTGAAKNTNVLPNATLGTRFDFSTTGGGVIDIDKAQMNWYPIFAQPYSVALTNFGAMSQILVQEIASPISWSQVGVGQEAVNPQFALSISTCFAGGSMDNCVWSTATLASAGRHVWTMTDLDGFTISNNKFVPISTRSNGSAGCITMTRISNTDWINNTYGGGQIFMSTCSDMLFTGSVYYDTPTSTTSVSNAAYIWNFNLTCADIMVDGLSFGGLTMTQPYNGVAVLNLAGSTGIKIRNIGTYQQPLDGGDVRQNDVAWSRVTTTATVTKANHGLKVNDVIYVIASDSVAAITVASKTVATVPTANTFTFACLNAGNASGVLSYYPTVMANLFVLGALCASSNVEIKRCYTPHLRTNLFTADNSFKNVEIANVMGDYINAPLVPQLNGTLKGVFAVPPMTAQTSCYGTHWFDVYTTEPLTGSAASWSRVTTTAAVTRSLHGLRTGDIISVTSSSAAAAIVLGQKTLTVTSSSIMTFTCLNAGATTGQLNFSTLSGRIGLLMNESTTETEDQYTIEAGNPGFTSAGGLYMPVVNDQVLFETPEYILGHTWFPIGEAVMAGGTLANYNLFYSIDKNDGLGFSAYKNLYYTRAGGGGSNASTNVTMTDTTGVAAGDYVFGTNIAPNAKVLSITNGTTVVVDIANVGAVSGILRFNQLPSESSVNGSLGIKLRIRFKTVVANATAITSLYVPTCSTTTSRGYQYPLDMVPLTLTNLQNPSEVRVFNAGTTDQIAGQEDVTDGTFTAEIDATTYPLVDIAVLSLGYQNIRYLSQVMGSGLSIPVSQVVDRQYSNS